MDQDSVFKCGKCGCEEKFAGSREKFLIEKGFGRAPMFCDACFNARLDEIWEIPGEKRLANCAKCGCETRLPFIPVNNKPVYCSVCFKSEA